MSLIAHIHLPFLFLFYIHLGIGDAHLAAPDIHRGTCVMEGNGPWVAMPYKNIRQENLAVSCTLGKKIWEYHVYT